MGSWTEEAGLRAIELWVEGLASGIGVRPKHRRSGDPGLWVRNKEQWADRRVMTANTRVRGPRRVSRSEYKGSVGMSRGLLGPTQVEVTCV